VPTLADHLRRRIADGGPLSVAEYMADALGHPRLGYYMTGDPFGRGGDFITAPEISQMFGELMGLWCAVQWDAMGRPDPVHLVEMGPGRGTLMADALRAARGVEGFVESLSISLVEISPALKSAQEDTLLAAGTVRRARSLSWVSGLDDVPEGPVLAIANEFLDALPVRQFVMTGDGWRERLVDVDETGAGFRFTASGAGPEPGVLPPGIGEAEEGAVAEVRPAASALARDMAGRLVRDLGAALFVDYGHARSAAGDTLQAVRGHAYADLLADPGEADLTAHVDFAEIKRVAQEAGAAVHGPVDQGRFLLELGIGARAEALRAAVPGHGSEIAADATRLTSAEGMGRLFKAMALTSPALPTPPGFE